MSSPVTLFLLVVIPLCVGCRRSTEVDEKTAQAPASAVEGTASPVAPPALRPHFIPVPPELTVVEPFVQREFAASKTAGERTLVYVGASWCEPCQSFHQAVERGELDALLGRTRFLEFDADRHGAMLREAGYVYGLIPVIAVPTPDGRSSGRLLSGSIKGPTAVEQNLVPRLRALLRGEPTE